MSPNEISENTLQASKSKNCGVVIASIAIIISLAAAAMGFYNFHAARQDHQTIAAQTHTVQTLQNSIATPTPIPIRSEVHYLIHLANLQLTLERNPVAAKKTLSLALSKSTDATLSAALNQNIADLSAVPKVDTHAIFTQLAELSQKIRAISLTPITAKPAAALQGVIDGAKSSDSKQVHWYDRIWNHLKYVKQFFIVRHVDSHSMPLVDPNLILSTKLNIDMQLSLAQWGLLHRDQNVYQAALQSISKSLTNYFSIAPTTTGLIAEIATLEKINIDPQLPSLDSTLLLLSKPAKITTGQS